jgi:hypothetical protein
MRNDFTACDGPSTAKAAATDGGRSRRRRTMRRGLLALPLALVLMVGGATAALAAEPTSGYGGNTPAPKTTPSPKGEAAPTNTSKTPTVPSKETPASNTEPTATTATKATTLPFTGLDLRWVILAGMLLVGMGMSIVLVQRGRGGSANR